MYTSPSLLTKAVSNKMSMISYAVSAGFYADTFSQETRFVSVVLSPLPVQITAETIKTITQAAK